MADAPGTGLSGTGYDMTKSNLECEIGTHGQPITQHPLARLCTSRWHNRRYPLGGLKETEGLLPYRVLGATCKKSPLGTKGRDAPN